MPGTSSADDGWGAATTVHGGSSSAPERQRRPGGDDFGLGKARTGARSGTRGGQRSQPRRADPPAPVDDGWSLGGPASSQQQRTNRSNQRNSDAAARRTEKSLRELERHREAAARPPERGVRAWVALLIVLVLAALGGLIDTVGAIEVQGGFNIGIIVASVVGILIVKRSHMFPVAIAPPIVYTLGAGFQYYVKASSGNAQSAKLDAAANYLVYGFPAIAAATAAVLIIAGIRMIARK